MTYLITSGLQTDCPELLISLLFESGHSVAYIPWTPEYHMFFMHKIPVTHFGRLSGFKWGLKCFIIFSAFVFPGDF